MHMVPGLGSWSGPGLGPGSVFPAGPGGSRAYFLIREGANLLDDV